MGKKTCCFSNAALINAATEIKEGYFEANLGGCVFKKRIATKGRGKRGSVRTIVAFKKAHHCFFIYGFEKNEKANITLNEKKAFKIVADELLNFSELSLKKGVENRTLLELDDE